MPITSFICGIVGLLCLVNSFFAINIINKYLTIGSISIINKLVLNLLFIPFLLSLLAIIFGFISKKTKNHQPFSLVGRILGFIGIIPVIIFTMAVMTNPVMFDSGKTHILIDRPGRPIYSYFTEIGTVTATTKDKNYAVVKVIIAYDQDDFTVSSELSSRQDELKLFIKNYFSNKHTSELTPENENILRQDIKAILNSQFLETGKIRLILFDELDISYPY